MNGIMRLFILVVVGVLFSGYAAASDEPDTAYLQQLVDQKQNAVAASCRASLPANSVRKSFYNVNGVLLEARDYCMYLAIQYVRMQMESPSPQIYIAGGESSESNNKNITVVAIAAPSEE